MATLIIWYSLSATINCLMAFASRLLIYYMIAAFVRYHWLSNVCLQAFLCFTSPVLLVASVYYSMFASGCYYLLYDVRFRLLSLTKWSVPATASIFHHFCFWPLSFMISCVPLDAIIYHDVYAFERYYLSSDVRLWSVSFIISCLLPVAILYHMMSASGRYYLSDVRLRPLAFRT